MIDYGSIADAPTETPDWGLVTETPPATSSDWGSLLGTTLVATAITLTLTAGTPALALTCTLAATANVVTLSANTAYNTSAGFQTVTTTHDLGSVADVADAYAIDYGTLTGYAWLDQQDWHDSDVFWATANVITLTAVETSTGETGQIRSASANAVTVTPLSVTVQAVCGASATVNAVTLTAGTATLVVEGIGEATANTVTITAGTATVVPSAVTVTATANSLTTTAGTATVSLATVLRPNANSIGPVPLSATVRTVRAAAATVNTVTLTPTTPTVGVTTVTVAATANTITITAQNVNEDLGSVVGWHGVTLTAVTGQYTLHAVTGQYTLEEV